ncbi:hypothetical protein P5F43_06555 [Clostridium perfringens]|uniref:hypothetical protein n=1 Tax=Clostridium perfringens TaxID=1502 RepID=UPI00156D823D|nr:hypothetical protein [Clostridium perfringens]EGT0690850.1 hypothetical protein [Clostridium perfringens]EGT0694008.1 hypothetical protein [Clostridium perfringens]EGT0697075.1 hypothetical protein [Clostridium perfringens]MBI6024453.1 hypothetical protein [Clostridium perfringens]MBI6048564.1 hypothetical protein [Clostridium perfringens]
MKITDEELQEVFGDVIVYKVKSKDEITRNILNLNNNLEKEVKFCYYKHNSIYYLMEANSISEDFKFKYLKGKHKLYCGLCHQEVFHTVAYYRAKDKERNILVPATFKHLKGSEKCDWYHSSSKEEIKEYEDFSKYKNSERESKAHKKAKRKILDVIGMDINIPFGYDNEHGIYDYKNYKIIDVKSEYSRHCKNSLRRRIVSDSVLICKSDDDIKEVDIEIFYTHYKNRHVYVKKAEETDIYATLEVQADIINEGKFDFLTNKNFYIYIKKFEYEDRLRYLEKKAVLLENSSIENKKVYNEIRKEREEKDRIRREQELLEIKKKSLVIKNNKKTKIEKKIEKKIFKEDKKIKWELSKYSKYYFNQIIKAIKGNLKAKECIVSFLAQNATFDEFNTIVSIFEYFYIKSQYEGFAHYKNSKKTYIEVMNNAGYDIREFKKENVLNFRCPCCKNKLQRKSGLYGNFVACSNYKCKFSFSC